MSADQIRALRDAAAADPAITLRFAQASSAEEAVAMAADLGYDVTAEELSAAAADLHSSELSEAELEAVAGAQMTNPMQTNPPGVNGNYC